MDASLVYGATPQLADALRERAGGRLKVELRNHNRPYPPTTRNKTAVCDILSEREPCYQFGEYIVILRIYFLKVFQNLHFFVFFLFYSGDRRANQNPQLTVLQIILLREHNRLATILSHINPHWDDETLYQEARRILIAEFQHISYYEWLPIILGKE